MLKEEKVYISKYEELGIEIIWLHYDILIAGHRKKWKTIKLMIRND